MLAQMRPYTPSAYLPDGFARYRQYPRTVVTPIPGAGYDVGKFVWAEQELNLDGSSASQPYGDYTAVPLRGLGAAAPGDLFSGMSAQERLDWYRSAPANVKSRIPASTVSELERQAAAERAAAQDAARPAWTAPTASQDTDNLVVRSESDRDRRAREAAAAATAFTMPAEETFFDKKLGPVPLWMVVGGSALAVIGGGAWYWMRRKK